MEARLDRKGHTLRCFRRLRAKAFEAPAAGPDDLGQPPRSRWIERSRTAWGETGSGLSPFQESRRATGASWAPAPRLLTAERGRALRPMPRP